MTFKVDKHGKRLLLDLYLLRTCCVLVAYFYRQLKTLSQVMKTEGTRPVIMFSFSETVHKLAYGWLEGQVNTTVVAVIRNCGRILSVRMWICRYQCSWMSLC